MTDRTLLQFDITFPSNNRVKNDLLNVHYIKKELHVLERQLTIFYQSKIKKKGRGGVPNFLKQENNYN